MAIIIYTNWLLGQTTVTNHNAASFDFSHLIIIIFCLVIIWKTANLISWYNIILLTEITPLRSGLPKKVFLGNRLKFLIGGCVIIYKCSKYKTYDLKIHIKGRYLIFFLFCAKLKNCSSRAYTHTYSDYPFLNIIFIILYHVYTLYDHR